MLLPIIAKRLSEQGALCKREVGKRAFLRQSHYRPSGISFERYALLFGGLSLILGALVGVAPVPPITSPLPVATPASAVVETMLPNGMRVIFLPNALAPVATVVTE